MQNNANQPQKTLKNTRLFKPLIASSLALALSASVANAGDCTSSWPDICYRVDSNSNLVDTTAKLNNLSFGQNSDYYVPQWNGSAASKVIFIFDNSTSTPDLSASYASSTLTRTGKTNGKSAEFKMRTGSGKSFRTNIAVDFGSGNNSRTCLLYTSDAADDPEIV